MFHCIPGREWFLRLFETASDRFLPDQWGVLTAIALSAAMTYANIFLTYPEIFILPSKIHHIRPDNAIFFQGGVLLAKGYAPYLHMWDVKPPMIYYTTWALVTLFPGAPWMQFWAGVALSNLVAVSGALLAGLLVFRRTDSHLALLATVSTIYGYVYFISITDTGLWTKHFAILFGLVSIWLSVSDHPIGSIVTASLSAAYWPFGAIFVVISFGMNIQRRYSAIRLVLALVLTTCIVVLPIALRGGVEQMITQVVLYPLRMGSDATGFLHRVWTLYEYAPIAFVLLVSGTLGGAVHVIKNRSDRWVGAGLLWTCLQLGFLDFDSYPDPFLFAVFAAIGLGLFLGDFPVRYRTPIAACVGLLAAVQISLLGDTLAAETIHHAGTGPMVQPFLEQKAPLDSCFFKSSSGSKSTTCSARIELPWIE